MNQMIRVFAVTLLACLSTFCSGDRSGQGQAGAGWLETIDNPPMARSDREKRVLSVIEDMDREERRRYLSVTVEDGRVLRALVEAVDAQRVVEVGTSTGYSDLWIALGLQSTGGKLTTYEIDPTLAQIARNNFKLAGVDGLITVVVGDAHVLVKEYQEPIDILFIDADKQGYVDYLNTLLPWVRPGGLVLAHNPANLKNAPGYIEAATQNPDLDTSFLLMGKKGLALTLKKR